jgi:hypothetical protein
MAELDCRPGRRHSERALCAKRFTESEPRLFSSKGSRYEKRAIHCSPRGPEFSRPCYAGTTNIKKIAVVTKIEVVNPRLDLLLGAEADTMDKTPSGV